jgi:hypothetical protein
MSTLLLASLATLVFCAPGYPGGAGDAQPYVEQFATAAATISGWPAGSLGAVYDPTEQGGLAKLASADAALAFIPYAFFVQHGKEMQLTPLVQADVTGIGTEERWTLVAKDGAVAGPTTLAGFTLLSVAGYAPEFVRHVALKGWPLPPEVKIEATGQILSALRRIAAGEPVVALLDQTQAAAMPTLPFAAQLKAVMQSPTLPVAILAVINGRVPAARVKALQQGLLKMSHDAGDADALAQLHLKGFVPLRIPTQPSTP